MKNYNPMPHGLNPDAGAVMDIEKHTILWARVVDLGDMNILLICSQQIRGGSFHTVCRFRMKDGKKDVYRKIVNESIAFPVAVARAKDDADRIVKDLTDDGAKVITDKSFTFKPYKKEEELIEQLAESGMFEIFSSPKK